MSARTVDRYEVVIVGGGQAGLAMAYYLAQQGRKFTILEAAAEPAAAWRQRWDSLTLFTPARFDSLPGHDFPGDPDGYPMRDDVVRYLSDYITRFDLPVQFDSRVVALRVAGPGYELELRDGRSYRADQVVVATGPFQVPRVPPISEDLDPTLVQYHSTGYGSPADVPAGVVLVVGGGNTGFQIAEELTATHDVHLAIGGKQPSLPQKLLGRDIFRYLSGTGVIRKPTTTRIGRRMRQRDPVLIGSSPRAAAKRGVTLHPRATGGGGRSLRFEDGTSLTVDCVIWATGFEVDHSWIDVPVFDTEGRVAHERGVTAAPGLYVLGLSWLYSRGSALLGWVKEDAAYLAEQVTAHSRTHTDAVEEPTAA